MAFKPSNTIQCDSIRLKLLEDPFSIFITVPYQSNYAKLEKLIRETCEKLNLHIQQLHHVGSTLVKNPDDILDEEEIVKRLTKRREYYPVIDEKKEAIEGDNIEQAEARQAKR